MLNDKEIKTIGKGLQSALKKIGGVTASFATGGTSGGTGTSGAYLPVLKGLFGELEVTLGEIEKLIQQASKARKPKKLPAKKKQES